MNVVNKIYVENHYSGSDWDFEKTTKYVFDIEGMMLEAGYFEHYCKDTLVKVVLEMPSSYGCPAKCKFCASSAIDRFVKLSDSNLFDIFEFLYREHSLEKQSYVLITMTGIGDIYFNYDNVFSFLNKLKIYENIFVTLSSCLWNVNLLQKIKELSQYIRFRNIQITYISYKTDILKKLIPFYHNKEYDIGSVISYIKENDEEYYRFNYLMINNVNDSRDDFEMFCQLIESIKNKVIIRISMLNETAATRRNGLESTALELLDDFQSILTDKKINCYKFYSLINDNMNCGQLITEKRGL